ncbi:MAG TPA: glycoside hydrolase family 97 N-terminal domain-containing protein, partial [Pyrinomonadaceae bacterium]
MYTAFFWALLGCAATAFAQHANETVKLRSPNDRVELSFALDKAGAPAYSVNYDGRALILPSTLGLAFKQGGALGGMTLAGTRHRAHDETYELVVGKTRRARDRYRELSVSLVENDGAKRKLQLVFRAYDDGVAFRYLLPAQDALKDFEITDERSEFRFPTDHTCWAMQLRTFHSNYEK